MKIILQNNVEGVGSVGEVVQVRDGYARNFLIPRGLASAATESNVRVVERQKAKQIQSEKEVRAKAEELARKIGAAVVTIEANAGEDDKLFGSITSADIQEALAAQGLTVDKKDVHVPQNIRKTGTYAIEVRCYTNLKANLKVQVLRRKS